MRNKITFKHRGFVVAVIYNDIEDEQSAIRVAAMHVVGRWTAVDVEPANDVRGGAE